MILGFFIGKRKPKLSEIIALPLIKYGIPLSVMGLLLKEGIDLDLIKTLKTKKAEDVSLVTLIMFICGVGSWIIYGYKISSSPILIANIITLILNLFILISKIYYSRNIR